MIYGYCRIKFNKSEKVYMQNYIKNMTNYMIKQYYLIKQNILLKMENEDKFKINFQEIEEDNRILYLYSGMKNEDGPVAMSQEVELDNNDEELNQEDELSLNDADDFHFRNTLFQKKGLRKTELSPTKLISKNQKTNKKYRNQMYIQLLEKKIQALEDKIMKLESVNKANEEYFKKINLPQQIINGFFVGKTHIYQRLEKLLKAQQTQQTQKELMREISSLQYRSSVDGKDRIKASNYYFQQLLQIFLTDVLKYFIYAVDKNIDFFDKDLMNRVKRRGEVDSSLSNQEKWRHQLILDMDLNQEKENALQNYKNIIKQEKIKYDQLILKFYSVKEEIQEQALKIHKEFNELRNFFNPYQLAKIFVNIHKNKYRKEVSLQNIQSFWKYQLERDSLMKVYTDAIKENKEQQKFEIIS